MKKIGRRLNLFLRRYPPGFHWTMYILFLSLLVVANTIFEFLLPIQYGEIRRIIHATDYWICASFFVDFCWRLASSANRLQYLRTTGWIDLLASVPYIRFLRWGKIVYLFAVVQNLRSAGRVFRFLFANKVSITLLFSFLIFVSSIIIAALSVLYFEKGRPGSTIDTAGEAIWWALNLASTCGNTDSVPVTTQGRIVGGILIVIGYSLFSINAGILSSWFMSNLTTVEKRTPQG